jgi:hypothetical protein
LGDTGAAGIDLLGIGEGKTAPQDVGLVLFGVGVNQGQQSWQRI